MQLAHHAMLLPLTTNSSAAGRCLDVGFHRNAILHPYSLGDRHSREVEN